MRARRVIAFLAVASALGVSACAAFLSDFSIGERADGGAAEGGVIEGGGSQDGTFEDAESTSDGGISEGGGADGSASQDGTSGDAGPTSDGGGTDGGAGGSDAGQDACATNGGTGAIGTLGCPCSTAGEPACNGNAQKLTLLCTGGVWVPDGTCASGQLCDSQPGANQGTCQPIDPPCTNATPGQDICSNAMTAVQCGPDLVSDSPVATCTNQACVSGACAGVCTPGATQCMSDTQVQTCSTTGQWVTTTCSDACVNGADGGPGNCGGVCMPGATQGCSRWDVGCGCDVGGSQTCGSNGQWGGCG